MISTFPSLFAHTDLRPGFELWLFPHLVLALLPPVYLLICRRRSRAGTRGRLILMVLVAAIPFLTRHAWAYVLSKGTLEEVLWIWGRCMLSGLIVLGVSIVVTLYGLHVYEKSLSTKTQSDSGMEPSQRTPG